MGTPSCALIVLRVASLERAATFYQALGLTFARHRHGTGPEHLAATLQNGTVLELYPKRRDDDRTSALRLGLAVDDVDQAVARLAPIEGAAILSPPKDSEWGRRAVLQDPDGHTIELTTPTP